MVLFLLLNCHEEYKIRENETNETTRQYVAKAGFTVNLSLSVGLCPRTVIFISVFLHLFHI